MLAALLHAPGAAARAAHRAGVLQRLCQGACAHGMQTGCSDAPSTSRPFASMPEMHGTTVLCVRKDGEVVMMADGQITLGSKVVKPNARKLRRLGPGATLGGFAGSTADGITLFERLEQKLEEHPGQLRRAAVELAKLWRQDRVLRHLQASMIVADGASCLEVSGAGEVLEPADGVHAIGSGSKFAVAAARALLDVPGMSAMAVAQRAMQIAAERCVYTNTQFVWEVIGQDGALSAGGAGSTAGGPGGSQ